MRLGGESFRIVDEVSDATAGPSNSTVLSQPWPTAIHRFARAAKPGDTMDARCRNGRGNTCCRTSAGALRAPQRY
jgi:hypothetical protein